MTSNEKIKYSAALCAPLKNAQPRICQKIKKIFVNIWFPTNDSSITHFLTTVYQRYVPNLYT